MFRPLAFLRSALVLAVLATPFAAAAEENEVAVVLVHGAFSNSSAWHKVIPILQESGIEVSAAQLPLSSLENDAAAVSRLIKLQEKPVVLVGHSYGGNVITEAGASEKVEALVYVAGFALDKGQSTASLLEGKPPAPWRAEAIADEGGYVRLSHKGLSTYFAPDLPESETALMAATQGPISFKVNKQAPTVAAWSMKPSYYVVAENDQIIPPKLQAYFAKRMGAKITKVPSSHVAMLAQPEAVANVIKDAVEAALTQ